MQKITKKIILLIIILVINFIGNNVSFATSSVNTRTRATASNNSTENESRNKNDNIYSIKTRLQAITYLRIMQSLIFRTKEKDSFYSKLFFLPQCWKFHF